MSFVALNCFVVTKIFLIEYTDTSVLATDNPEYVRPACN